MYNLIFGFLFTTTSSAAIINTEIAEVHLSGNVSVPSLIFLMQDGIVGKLPMQDIKTLLKITEAVKNHRYVSVVLDEDRYITSVENSVQPPPRKPENTLSFLEYVPTILPDMEAAKTIFFELNPHFRRRAECFNKAHVWVYEENKKRNLNSMKVFLFFTTKYIWDYDWDWWFHVSPYVMVKEGNEITENVIDYTFMKGPTKMHQWTDYFIIPKTECPTVEKYSDYENHQQENYCYLIKKSMYFWQPMDIDALERTGVEKTGFIKEEVDTAYWQGF